MLEWEGRSIRTLLTLAPFTRISAPASGAGASVNWAKIDHWNRDSTSHALVHPMRQQCGYDRASRQYYVVVRGHSSIGAVTAEGACGDRDRSVASL